MEPIKPPGSPPSMADLLTQLPDNLRAEVEKYQDEYQTRTKDAGMKDSVIDMILLAFTLGASYAATFIKEHRGIELTAPLPAAELTLSPGSNADLLSQMPGDLRKAVEAYKVEAKKKVKGSGGYALAGTVELHEFTRGAAFAATFLKKQSVVQ
jgi:hypothetical protein